MQSNGWEFLVLCFYADKSCDHEQCDGGDIVFLICQVTCRQHMFKGLYELMGGSSS